MKTDKETKGLLDPYLHPIPKREWHVVGEEY